MKILRSILGLLLIVAATGCATYQGGTADEYNTETGAAVSGPVASPSMRPGMNPNDPRDSHFTTRPQPDVSPDPSAVPP